MKKFLLLSICLLWTAVAFAVETSSAQNAADTVTFDGEKYSLQYSVGNAQQWLNEYLPAGVNFDSYTTMFTVRSYDKITATSHQIASSIINNLLRSSPDAEYNFLPGEGKDTGIYFLVSNGKILEFNIFRITQQNGHPLALQFVYRVFITDGNTSAAAEKMKSMRSKKQAGWTKELMDMPVPVINRTVKK